MSPGNNSVYEFSPNPVQNEFCISFKKKSFSTVSMTIYNAVGQLVLSKNYKDVFLIQESIGDLPAGLYSVILY